MTKRVSEREPNAVTREQNKSVRNGLRHLQSLESHSFSSKCQIGILDRTKSFTHNHIQ